MQRGKEALKQESIEAGKKRGMLAGKELCLRSRHYDRWSGKETGQALDGGRHVQRQAGRQSIRLRGRHYGRWSGKETSQALEQASMEAGM